MPLPTLHQVTSRLKWMIPSPNLLNRYVMSAPSPQNALNLFKGEWVSKLPGEWAGLQAGDSALFEDERIDWFVQQLGGVANCSVLELGPLEAGHTYMLQQAGAASILAIEANPHAYLKCLVIKEIMGLNRARFWCGDFVPYLQNCPDKFNIGLACGVLYHMTNPVELIALLAKVTNRVCLWTHYYDAQVISNKPHLYRQFVKSQPAEYAGFQHQLHRRLYQKNNFNWAGFHGGGAPSSCWLTRNDLLRSLEYFGLTQINIGWDDLEHRNGPNILLVASRPE
jgi:hypothetical protein